MQEQRDDIGILEGHLSVKEIRECHALIAQLEDYMDSLHRQIKRYSDAL